MTVFVILEDNIDEIKAYDKLPSPAHLPYYTYGFDVEAGTWYRVHQDASPRGRGRKEWVQLNPHDPSEGVPKHIRAAVLILGG